MGNLISINPYQTTNLGSHAPTEKSDVFLVVAGIHAAQGE